MRFLDVPIGQPDFFDPQSAWLRHGPFGMWLMGALRPEQIVELGTHTGYSYFSFCQAVRDHGLLTRCVAVDTWDGDEHAGFFDASVHEGVVARNATYAPFSTLLRKTFADARADIADGSVDLLHVDGRHFYDDVKGDFESWIPKLSQRAVVLFHDTEVRERGFGVYRYWAEIARTRPSINLPHENGLGVLFWGPQTDGAITQLVKLLRTDGGDKAVIATFDLAGELRMQAYHHAQAQHRAAQDYAEHQEREARRQAKIIAEHEEREALLRTKMIAEHQEREIGLLAEIEAEHAKVQKVSDRVVGLLAEIDAERAKVQQVSDRVSAAERSIHQLQEDAEAHRSMIARLADELRRARSKPLSQLGTLIAFKLLRGLSKIGAVPAQTRQRFSRSAAKRDPKRLLPDRGFAGTRAARYGDSGAAEPGGTDAGLSRRAASGSGGAAGGDHC